jgi:RHS repeat-associated protein
VKDRECHNYRTDPFTGGIGGLLARSSGYSSGNWTTHNYYFADGNGNVTYMLNSSQTMVASYRYDPFGNTISSSGSLANDNVYRFSSKEIHVNSGLYYFGYRFYDPSLKRWINRDPIGEDGGENLYGYAQNHPTGKIDAFGMFPYVSNKNSYNNCCCKDNVVQAGRVRLANNYNQIERQLLNDKIPRSSSNPSYSCISENGYVLNQLRPAPPCWVCWLEHRGKSFVWLGGASWDYDHWVVVCESLPSSGAGDKIVFDYWGNMNGVSFSALERKWPYSFPRDYYLGSYRDCSGSVSQGDLQVNSFPKPPAGP